MAKPPYMDFAYIKQHADFRAILAHFGIALPEGAQERIKVRCPFHHDEHPSLSINLTRSSTASVAGRRATSSSG